MLFTGRNLDGWGRVRLPTCRRVRLLAHICLDPSTAAIPLHHVLTASRGVTATAPLKAAGEDELGARQISQQPNHACIVQINYPPLTAHTPDTVVGTIKFATKLRRKAAAAVEAFVKRDAVLRELQQQQATQVWPIPNNTEEWLLS